MAIDVINSANSALNKVKVPLQEKITNNNFATRLIKMYDPTGANNTFAGLTTLMIGTVVLPRVNAAKKRNPGNKEATKDEIKEILFRDIQTIGIILFALKATDAVIGRIFSKFNGLPLTNKAYQKVFQKDPNLSITDRVKNALINVKDTIKPGGGIFKYSNDEIVSRYSNYDSIEQVQKLFRELPQQGGDNKKVFAKIMKSIVENQKKLIATKKSEKVGGITVSLKKAEELLKKLTDIQKEGKWEVINDPNLDKDVSGKIVEFFGDKNNALVTSGKKLSAWLKTAALAMEVSYLGFGLPALNQKRLEKKYLSEKDNIYREQFHNAARNINSSVLVDKTIKPQEIALYHHFIK